MQVLSEIGLEVLNYKINKSRNNMIIYIYMYICIFFLKVWLDLNIDIAHYV